MKLFNIYTKKSKNNPIEDLIAVGNCFSFSAFLFSFLWFLQHKMWKESITVLVINIIFGIVIHRGWFSSYDAIIIELGLLLIIGLNAQYWYEQNLLGQDYQFIGCVFGKNKDEAKLRFISNCFKDSGPNGIFCPSIANLHKTEEQQYFSV